ncbi:Non-specific serine/threonine protein kinase [Bertholletia excelsa]
MWSIRIYIALGGVILGFIIAIAAAFLLILWKRRKQISGKMGDLELQKLSLSARTTSEKKISFDQNSQDTLDGHVIVDVITPHKMLLECYTLDELSKATENFSSSNLIEGSVFHSRLNGKNLAIKRTNGEHMSKVDFGLLTDHTHHHPNIVRLIGACSSEGPNGFLVFEYARNGSLKDWLHGGLAVKSQFIASCFCFLSWNQRLRIGLDVATAIHYMHQIMIPSYVHCNIKSRNIFLDEEFNAKVGNFGMARFVEEEEESEEGQSSSSLANQFSWREGYLAPEYLRDGTAAPSIDIFAYGVVLLELMSGQTPMTRGEKKGEDYVKLAKKIRWVLRSEGSEGLREWMDPALGENYSFEAAVTLANLAGACVEDDPSMRPSAGEIVEKLSRLVEEMPPEGDQFPAGESSTKPLVMSTRNQST